MCHSIDYVMFRSDFNNISGIVSDSKTSNNKVVMTDKKSSFKPGSFYGEKNTHINTHNIHSEITNEVCITVIDLNNSDLTITVEDDIDMDTSNANKSEVRVPTGVPNLESPQHPHQL